MKLDPLDTLDVLGEGVLGYEVVHEDATYIPLIVAENPGTGQVGRWLDALDPALTWKIPNVTSARLHRMLERRSWALTIEHDPLTGEDVDVWVRPCKPG